MNDLESAVRAARDTLSTAIAAARAAGYVVGPHRLDDTLEALSISATGAIETAPEPSAAPAAPQAEPEHPAA